MIMYFNEILGADKIVKFSHTAFYLVLQIFHGNKDRMSVVSHTLGNTIKSSAVRFWPLIKHNFVSMRAELYGCLAGNWCCVSLRFFLFVFVVVRASVMFSLFLTSGLLLFNGFKCSVLWRPTGWNWKETLNTATSANLLVEHSLNAKEVYSRVVEWK